MTYYHGLSSIPVLFFCVWSLFVIGGEAQTPQVDASATGKAFDTEKTAELIRNLGDENWETRRSAQRAL
jgi:hypothetical protein